MSNPKHFFVKRKHKEHNYTVNFCNFDSKHLHKNILTQIGIHVFIFYLEIENPDITFQVCHRLSCNIGVQLFLHTTICYMNQTLLYLNISMVKLLLVFVFVCKLFQIVLTCFLSYFFVNLWMVSLYNVEFQSVMICRVLFS